jgi:solute carrier family 12 (potassium/chloride transporter), member 4/6
VELKGQEGKYKETTLMGVFFPVLNNIFGALLFIRQPELVGEAGMGLFFLILILCVSSTFSTSLSLSALCSNGRIRHGGTYFILSRALGAPLGTAIGFCFYIGVNINAANFILSMGETYLKMGGAVIIEGDFISNMRVYGIFIWFVLITLNLTGLKYVSSAGLLFMAGVVLAILGGFIGIGIGNGNLKDEAKGISGWDGLSS